MSIRNTKVSARAEIITRRTYNRPKNEEGTVFETWEETIDRVIGHQEWLWRRAKKADLSVQDYQELAKLRKLMVERKATVSGRTLWLGGTNVSQTREASQFNCSFGEIETVHDVVDSLWLLFRAVVSALSQLLVHLMASLSLYLLKQYALLVLIVGMRITPATSIYAMA